MNRTDFEEQLTEYVAGELPAEDAEEMAAYIRRSPDAAVLERDFRLLFEAGNAIRADVPPVNLMPQANAQLFERLKHHRAFSLNGKTRTSVYGRARSSLARLVKPLWRPIPVCGLAVMLLVLVDILSGHTVIAQVAERFRARMLRFDDQGAIVEEQTIPKVEVNANEIVIQFEDGSIDTLPIPSEGNTPPRLLSPEESEELAKVLRRSGRAILIVPTSKVAGKETAALNDSVKPAVKGWGEVKVEATNTPSR